MLLLCCVLTVVYRAAVILISNFIKAIHMAVITYDDDCCA